MSCAPGTQLESCAALQRRSDSSKLDESDEMDEIILGCQMTMKRVSANDAKQRFGEMLDAAQRAPVVIERHGRPRAVLMSFDDYDEAERHKLVALKRDIQVGLDDLKAGRAHPLDIDKIKRNARKKALRRA